MAKQYPKINRIPVNVVADFPDAPDWVYQPALIQLKSELTPSKKLKILNQGREGACTGFGLAAAINLLNTRRKNNISVSPRMLYEMARKFDEWEGDEYSGSSCRGAIQGWVNMGVCEESHWVYKSSKPGALSVAAAKNARSNTIGAYYRMMPRIADFHAALNEAGAIFCSANVHKGWSTNQVKSGKIPFNEKQTGGHAFLLVGYNSKLRATWVILSSARPEGKFRAILYILMTVNFMIAADTSVTVPMCRKPLPILQTLQSSSIWYSMPMVA